MREVAPGLFVGSQFDYSDIVGKGVLDPESKQGWAFVHACKEPFHREALGYTGRGAPKDHDEYLFARRGDRLILNLVDVDDPAYVRPEIIEAALDFIDDMLASGKRVLVHCNQGHSRGPSIALAYLVRIGHTAGKTHGAAEEWFKGLYPDYAPAKGMREYLRANWNELNP